MPCYFPLTGYYSREIGDTGKRRLTFSKLAAHTGVPLRLPCGKCDGCRLDRAKAWAIRCMHEKQLYNESSFLTLTYDDKHLPENGSLRKDDLQRFMKRLREDHRRKYASTGLRFFACGEYGRQTWRPHYHVLLFNLDFDDRRFYKSSGTGDLFRSSRLNTLWAAGECIIGDVTFASCAYVARYVIKKQTGEAGVNHYNVQLPDGSVLEREPEFTTMSRRPGLGRHWFELYGDHSYKWDSVIFDGKAVRSPRYYDDLYGRVNAEGLEKLKFQRRTKAISTLADRTPERRKVRAAVARGALRLKTEVL